MSHSFLLTCALIYPVFVSGLSWRQSTNTNLDAFSGEEIARAYADWRKHFGIVDDSRLKVFVENWKCIIKWNDGRVKPSYTRALNQFGDLTSEEFTARMLRKRDYSHFETTSKFIAVGEPPDSIDWTKKGVVPPVPNGSYANRTVSQANALVSTLECLARINKQPQSQQVLSPQELLDCSPSSTLASMEAYMLNSKGLCNVQTYPMTSGPCRNTTCGSHFDAFTQWFRIAADDEFSMKSATANGCVLVTVDATDLQHYSSGIYSGSCGVLPNHVVTMVGYGKKKSSTGLGDDDDHRYWKLQNEWGTSWGEKGYFRLKRHSDDDPDGPGECGVLQNPAFPGFYK